MSEYFVSYSIGTRVYQAGPYPTWDEAETHRRDIASYSGVKECFISYRRNPLRTLIGADDTSADQTTASDQ